MLVFIGILIPLRVSRDLDSTKKIPYALLYIAERYFLDKYFTFGYLEIYAVNFFEFFC